MQGVTQVVVQGSFPIEVGAREQMVAKGVQRSLAGGTWVVEEGRGEDREVEFVLEGKGKFGRGEVIRAELVGQAMEWKASEGGLEGGEDAMDRRRSIGKSVWKGSSFVETADVALETMQGEIREEGS